MRKIYILVGLLILAPCVYLLVVWLNPHKCQVTGTLTKDGKAVEWKHDKHVLQIIFVPVNRTSNPDIYRCEGDPQTGAYSLQNVPAGKYRVSIQLMDPYPTHDQLNFAYGLNNSPLLYEVAADCVIDIDIP